MDSKRIALLGGDNLLLNAVEKLLGTKEVWEVVRFSDDWDDDTLIHEVKNVCPDVFILHEGTFFEKRQLLAKFLQDFPRLKVVTINLEKNLLDVYDKQTIRINHASDLLAIIADDVVLNTQGGVIDP